MCVLSIIPTEQPRAPVPLIIHLEGKMPPTMIDITLELHPGMVVYPGDPPFRRGAAQSISAGDSCNLSLLSLGTHTGTHADAPRHLLEEGKGIDQLPLDYFMGKAKVFDLRGRSRIMADDLRPLPIRRGDIVLLRTSNSDTHHQEWREEYVALALDAAEYLSEKAIRTLGIDGLSIEPPESHNLQVHQMLLAAGIVILEGLDLARVVPGEYWLCAPPLKIRDGDGAPLRAVLIKN